MKFSSIKQLIVFTLIGLFSTYSQCEKDMLLTEFSDEYQDFKPELRIEAILNTTTFNKSIVRIDKTIPVTDRQIFDGQDNDGDWVGFDDLNGNGKWDANEPLNDDLGEDGNSGHPSGFNRPETGQGDNQPTQGEPHIDELDEILPQIHDSTYAVTLVRQPNHKKVASFQWTPQAGSFQYVENIETEIYETVYYGGYTPQSDPSTDTIAYHQEYEFIIQKGLEQINGSFTPLPPAQFLSTGFDQDQDTLITNNGNNKLLLWRTDPQATVFWVLVEKIYAPDSIEIVNSHPAAPFMQDQTGKWVGGDLIDMYFPGLYRWTVIVPSRDYGHYFYSSLPMRDEAVSNLRDTNNQVVLGIAGAVAETVQYVRIKNGNY